MVIQDIEKSINSYKKQGKKLFATSSFQTHSIPMLHILAQIDSSIPVYFINTGFLFAKTVEYKNLIGQMLGIKIIDALPLISKQDQRNGDGQFYFASDPDYCCYLNKVQSLDPILAKYDVWINGVRSEQTDVRKTFQHEQAIKNGCIRFHPMLDWTKQEIYRYIREHDLPRHPLDTLGYSSIGCEPCTHKPRLDDEDRNVRWFGLSKTECGLNTTLINLED